MLTKQLLLDKHGGTDLLGSHTVDICCALLIPLLPLLGVLLIQI